MRRRLRLILIDGGGAGLDEVLAGQACRIEQLSSRVDALNALEQELESSTRRALQKMSQRTRLDPGLPGLARDVDLDQYAQARRGEVTMTRELAQR